MEKREINNLLIRKILIVVFALVGFITTIKLAIIYYDSNFNPYALPSFCSVNEFVDCDGVAQTTHSQFLGIPLAFWGMGLYLFIIFLVFVDKLKRIRLLHFLEVFKNPLAYISTLGIISFAISMVLAGVSVFEIKKICILCVFTYFLNLLIAVVATDFSIGFIENFKISIRDFIDTLRIKKYLISFIALVVLVSSFLTYTTLSYVFTPQVKRYNAIVKYAHMKSGAFKVSGNTMGDPNAKLTVYIYTDYMCPICRAYNVMVHRVVQELQGFKIVHRNLPLDMDCNKYLTKPFHQGSCLLAKYSIAAEKQGRLWDLNSEFFDNEPKSEDEVLKLAKSIGFNTIKLRKDAYSSETTARLNKDIDEATNLGIDGTPALVINGKVYNGIKPYYELKDILKKAGAVERKQ